MRRSASILGSMLAAAYFALALSGCQPVPEISLNLSALEFSATDSDFPLSITSENGDLDWTIETSAPWLMVSSASGTGDAQVQISIDRALLDPSQASTGTVRVRAGDQELTIEVTAVSGFTPINTAYFPMAPGNNWTYSLSTLNAPLDGPFMPSDLNAPSLRMEVKSRIESAGFEVWQVELSLPDFATNVGLFKGATLDDLMGDVPSVDTYWVLVDGAWYITAARENVDLLPDTARFAPLAALLEWPTTLAYLETSGLLEEASQEVIGLSATRARALDDIGAAFSEYVGRIYENDSAALYALANAFGDAFEAYQSDDPVLTSFVRLLADISSSLEPINTFATNANEILIELAENAPQLQEPPLDLAYWTAWDNEFGAYENSDPALQALVRLFSQVALELATFLDATMDYSQDDYRNVSIYLSELYDALSGNAGLFAMNPQGFVDVIRSFATDYPTESAATQAIIDATLRVMAELEAAIPVFEDFMAFPIDTTGLRTFLQDADAFNSTYVNANGANATTDFTGFLFTAGLALEPELRALAPSLNAIAAELEGLQEAAENHLITDFELDNLVTVTADFETFFTAYDTEHGDALAAYLAIETGYVGDVLGVASRIITEAKNAPYEDVAGALEELLPDTPINVAIEEFGDGVQSSDCISPRILVETEDTTHHIASMIYARDIGPVLFSFLPLQYGEVNGTAIGTAPVP